MKSMKKILITVLVLTAFGAAKAEKPAGDKKPSEQPANTQQEHKTKEQPATQPTPPEDSANYIGTNDFYLALVREGIRKA